MKTLIIKLLCLINPKIANGSAPTVDLISSVVVSKIILWYRLLIANSTIEQRGHIKLFLFLQFFMVS